MNNEEPTLRPLSKEETTKTQILNLNEVNNAAKEEIKISKIKFLTTFLFVLGSAFLLSGICYNPIVNLISKSNEKEDIPTTNLRKNTGPVECTIKSHDEQAGINKELTYKFNFNNKTKTIKSYTKKLVVKPITTSETSQTTINDLLQKYKTLQTQKVNGYSINTTQNKNDLEIYVIINLESITGNTFPEVLKQDPVTIVEYKLTDQKENIINIIKNKGYKCN